MGSRRTVLVFLILAALAGAGCGDDDDNGDSGDGGTDTQVDLAAAGQDAQAKSDARKLVTFLEACFVDQMDYSACKDAAGGEDVGEATVESADVATYTIVSPSESGNDFRIEKTDAGELERTCETAGEGGCGADGSW